MFRDFTKRNAEKFGIVGTVRNADDGTVQVIAEGEEASAAIFLEELKKGSFLSRVDHIETIYKDPIGEFSDFKIIYAR